MLGTHDLIGYIDPMSGTFLVQALIAGAMGIAWRIATLFGRRKRDAQPAASPAQQSEAHDGAAAGSGTDSTS